MGHNSEQDNLRRQQFHKLLGQIKVKESDIAGTKGDLAALYDRAKISGISKDVLKLAKKWGDMSDTEIAAEVRDIFFVAQELKTAVGRQLSLLDEDRAPTTEVAHDAGYLVGVQGGDATNPYDHACEEGQAWQNGFNEGNTFRNAEFKVAIDAAEEGDEEGDDDGDEDDGADNEAGDDGEEFTDDDQPNP